MTLKTATKKILKKILPQKVRKGLRLIQREGMGEFTLVLKRKLSAKLQKRIKFSIIVPLYNTDAKFLREMMDSVLVQSHQNWELCLADSSDVFHGYVGEICKEYAEKDSRIIYKKLDKNEGISGNSNIALNMASGDYIALLDHDDLLAPDALFQNAMAINETKAEVLYSDEIHLSQSGEFVNPFYKPDWSPDLLYSQNYVCHFLVFKKNLLKKVHGFRSEFDGAQDYDLTLRLSECSNKIHHIPKLLYIWRESPTSTASNADSKPYAHDAGKKALDGHLKRKYGKTAFADDGKYLFTYDARFPLSEEPLVSIIIPMKDKSELTDACIKSILQKTNYKNYEIIVLDNRSVEQETFAWFEKIEKTDNRIRILKADMEFNWSKLNNFGIKHANGDVYVFLNNDILLISEDWLQRLAENAMRTDNGVVGAQLLYEDNTIQHAGVVVGMGGWADHVFKGQQPVHFGMPFVSSQMSRDVLAVTGACMAISKRTLKKIGFFDERFVICGSDVEICIRAHEAGLLNRYDANVRLYHLESKSRDSFIPEIDFEMSKKCYKRYWNHQDPFYNMNLDLNTTTPQERPDIDKGFMKSMKDNLKTNELVYNDGSQYNISELEPIIPRRSDCQSKNARINILVPSLNKQHVFGGISTALRFYNELIEISGFEGRIIITDAILDIKNFVSFDEYDIVDSNSDSETKYQIVSFADRHGKTIPVRKNDIFMATAWWTAYNSETILKWQCKEFNQGILPLIYLIQDYEPGFYAWSSRYLLADSTYKMQIPTYAVFNSSLLKNFFKKNEYEFKKEWYFEPKLNSSLKKVLLDSGKICNKKRKILVYGRPNTDRNAWQLTLMALKEWARIYKNCSNWEVYSAGEKHDDINLTKECKLISLGKLSLEEYAQIMLETYAGISLMVSPHPSYPPLEMSTFGIKTITNCYSNKDLSCFNENITSLKACSSSAIAEKLNELCENYSEIGNTISNSDYVRKELEFDHIPMEIVKSLNSLNFIQ